jgi:hypothetical protein
MSPDGDDRGSNDADRTEYSFTANVPLTIDQMLSGKYAMNVHESEKSIGNSIACGNIGGVADSVGTLVIGLRQRGGSDVTGIAVLSPSPANSSMSFASVFITGSGLGDAIGTIDPDPAPADDANPPVADAPPVNDSPPGTDPPPDDGDDGGDDDGGDDDGEDDESDDD